MNKWAQVLLAQQADSAALASSTTPTSILNGSTRASLPSNSLEYVGQSFTFKARGRISTVVTTPGNLTLELRVGASTVIWSSGAIALNTTAQVNATWALDVDFTVRSVGSGTGTTVLGVGELKTRALLGSSAVGTLQGVGVALLPDTAPVVGSGFDNSVSNTLDLFATWSVSNAANSILSHLALPITWQ